MLLLIAACWQPTPFAAPPPAQVEASDVLEGTAAGIRPGEEAGPPPEEAGPEGEDAAGEPEPAPGEDDPPDPPAPAVAHDVAPWKGHTVGTPVSLVGDDGKPLQVLRVAGASVTVLQEGEDRLKVRCDDCRPVVEAWVQRRLVER